MFGCVIFISFAPASNYFLSLFLSIPRSTCFLAFFCYTGYINTEHGLNQASVHPGDDSNFFYVAIAVVAVGISAAQIATIVVQVSHCPLDR